MFWTFTNPIRSFRRGAYTLVPSTSRRGSAQSLIDEEKGAEEKEGEEDGQEEVELLEEKRRRGSKLLVILLLGSVALTAVYHHYSPRLGTNEALAPEEQEILEMEQTEEIDIPREVVYDEEYDPTHVYLSPLTKLPHTRPLLGNSDIPSASAGLLKYLETGLATLDDAQAHTAAATVDIVYLWVNSTDPAFPEAYATRMEEEELAVDRGQARRWRDNGELRGAIRSSVASLGEGLRRVHVVSADYPSDTEADHTEPLMDNGDQGEVPDSNEEEMDLDDSIANAEVDWQAGPTVGQIPEWLDWSAQEDGTTDQVFWHFHSDIFRLPRQSKNELTVDDHALGRFELVTPNDDGVDRLEDAWRELALPSFNSFAIESRVGWINGLSENFILSNDDMFFLTPMSASDFHHPLLGPVLRLSTGLTVQPHITPDLYSSHGEWGGLQYASQLLGRRFTRRSQPYPEHFPKSLTVGMMDEASLMFANELGEAATRGFRESKRGVADIEMAALASWLRVERWREALLWTYIVARTGGDAGTWGEQERDGIEDLFGAGSALREGKNVLFRKGPRSTIADAAAAAAGEAGVEQPLNTRIKFSSLDGHIPRHFDHPASQCFFTPYCLPDEFFTDRTKSYPATEMFTRLAFDRPACGDCLIDALVTASGERGLEAFLPDPETTFTTTTSGRGLEARLPLTNDWRTTNFSLASILPRGDEYANDLSEEVSLRNWCLRLLSHYIYSIGDTPAVFAPVASAHQLASALSTVDTHPRTALVCVNDDVPDSADNQDPAQEQEEAGRFKRTLEEWMESRWPTPGGWERRS